MSLFTELRIQGMTEEKWRAYVALRRIEHTLHYLPIAARFNRQREDLHQQRAKLLRVLA